MKTKAVSFAVLFMLSVFTVFAEEKTEKFEVKGGDCDECKTHIETTATGVEGVSSAEWDKESKELTVIFDDAVATLESIEMAVANAGNNTPNYKASEEAFNALPECCQYEKEE